MVSILYPHGRYILPAWSLNLSADRYGNNVKRVFFKHRLWIDIFSTSCEIGYRWVPQDSIDDKSELVQVIGNDAISNKPLPEPVLSDQLEIY